jgi:hypothetical protein
MNRHPSVQWVLWAQTTQGFVVRCEACGSQGALGALQQVDAFASQHREHRSAAQGHLGLGDVVARATKAIGAKPCTPCEKRREQLNGLFPRVWRR